MHRCTALLETTRCHKGNVHFPCRWNNRKDEGSLLLFGAIRLISLRDEGGEGIGKKKQYVYTAKERESDPADKYDFLNATCEI